MRPALRRVDLNPNRQEGGTISPDARRRGTEGNAYEHRPPRSTRLLLPLRPGATTVSECRTWGRRSTRTKRTGLSIGGVLHQLSIDGATPFGAAQLDALSTMDITRRTAAPEGNVRQMRTLDSKNGVDDPLVRPRARGSSKLLPLLLVLAVVVAVLAGAAAGSTILGSPGVTNYACASITRDGSALHITTTGLIHRSGSQYDLTCSEGATLPSSSVTVSCLTIVPQTSSAPYPGGSTTPGYYLSSQGHAITLMGAPANATEVIQPTNAWLQVTC